MPAIARLAVHTAALAGLAAVALAAGRWLRDPEPGGSLVALVLLAVVCGLALRRLYGPDGLVALRPRAAQPGPAGDERPRRRARRTEATAPADRRLERPARRRRAPSEPRPVEHLWGTEVEEPAPEPGRRPQPAATAAPSQAAAGLVDLNTASDAELQTLPNIGPRMAVRIQNARPFTSVDDLANVPGLTAERVAELTRLVRV